MEVLGEDSSVIKKNIEIGISDDTKTEIISGLNERENVILKTTTGTSSTKTSSSSSKSINPIGGGPMGGSAVMMR